MNEAPKGWPLNRPLTYAEWNHIIKAFVVRRVPRSVPIEREALITFAAADVDAAVGVIPIEKSLHINKDSYGDFKCEAAINQLTRQHIIRHGVMVSGDEGIYRTDATEMFEEFLPETVKIVVNFLPVSYLVDLLAAESADPDF